jgi:hypothetical protein
VTYRSHRMQKHMFDIMCPSALFMETAPGTPKHEKWYIDVSRLGRMKMYSVTHISHQM